MSDIDFWVVIDDYSDKCLVFDGVDAARKYTLEKSDYETKYTMYSAHHVNKLKKYVEVDAYLYSTREDYAIELPDHTPLSGNGTGKYYFDYIEGEGDDYYIKKAKALIKERIEKNYKALKESYDIND